MLVTSAAHTALDPSMLTVTRFPPCGYVDTDHFIVSLSNRQLGVLLLKEEVK